MQSRMMTIKKFPSLMEPTTTRPAKNRLQRDSRESRETTKSRTIRWRSTTTRIDRTNAKIASKVSHNPTFWQFTRTACRICIVWSKSRRKLIAEVQRPLWGQVRTKLLTLTDDLLSSIENRLITKWKFQTPAVIRTSESCRRTTITTVQRNVLSAIFARLRTRKAQH